MSASTVSDQVESEVSGSMSAWAALDSQYERLIDPADPLLGDRQHHGHGRGHDRPQVIRWHPERACA